MKCSRHLDVETGLSCGRCDTPICPRCVVATDVGSRCPSCSPSRAPTHREVKLSYLSQASTAALASGAALGLIWGLIMPQTKGGISLLSLVVGALIGYLIAAAIGKATHQRSGLPFQLIAVVGVAVAYFAHNLAALFMRDLDAATILNNDPSTYVAAIIAAGVAYYSLR